MKTRVIALALAILALFIFVGSPFQQAANAVVGVSTGIIAIIIAALAACGITFATTGSFGTLEEYVGSLFTQYCTDSNVDPTEMLRGVNTGSNRIGQILVNNRFLVILNGFITWIKLELGLIDNQRKNVVSGYNSIGGLVIYSLPFVIVHNRHNGVEASDFEYTVISGSPNTYLYFVAIDNAYIVHFISSEESTVNMSTVNPNGQITSENYTLYVNQNNGWYGDWNRTQVLSVYWYQVINNYQSYTQAEVNQWLANNVITPGSTPIDAITGTINPPFDDENYDPGDGAIIDVNAPWGISYDDITDVIIPGEFAGDGEADVSIEYETEEEVSEQVEDSPTASVSQEVDDYQVTGLTSVFPFCIPFDIYNFFECLAAEPLAPSFEWRFYVPGICDETIELDLSEFDTVAQIVRTMELLAFIVGLAFVTRDKMIKG